MLSRGKFSEDSLSHSVPTPETLEGYPKAGPSSLVTAGEPIKDPGPRRPDAWD